jgi:hypothetical protein
MPNLGSLFSSSAQTDILWALHYQTRPVGLRFLANLAGVHPHSAERVIKSLVRKGLISRHKTGYRLEIEKCPTHPDWEILTPVFNAIDCARAHRELPELNARAKIILPFIEEAFIMIHKAKRSRRAT